MSCVCNWERGTLPAQVVRSNSPYLHPPPPGFEFPPPWYLRPQFYIPVAAVALLISSLAIYMSILASGLKAEAAGFDISHLEQMESASVIVDRNDKIFGQIYVENRETIPYDQIPRNLVNAVVSVEDAKFYQHRGYDFGGIIRAALKNFAAGHVRQGASTITQQLARNSFALKERTFRRKLLEIYLAKRIEESFGKQKIMELYLNRIYFGGGLYGAEAAARGYFAKPARDMTLTECATLAGLIKSPNRLSPWNDKAQAKEARNYALERMRSLGFIDRSTCASAQAEEVVISNRQNAQGQTYAVDYIRQKVIEAVGWDRAMNEGYRIPTPICNAWPRIRCGKVWTKPNASTVTLIKPTPITPRRLRKRNRKTRCRSCPRRNICRARCSRSITRPAEFSRSSADAISSTTNTIARCRRGDRPEPR